MARPRIVHRSTRVRDQRQVVQTPLGHSPPATAAGGLHGALTDPPGAIVEGRPYGAPSDPPRLTAVNGAGVMHQVQMENVHPLRLRILLEIDRTGSISAAASPPWTTCGGRWTPWMHRAAVS